MQGELALEVRCLVFRDGVLGSEAVEHSRYLHICFLCLCFVGKSAEATNCVTSRLSVIAVAEAAGFCLANAF